MKRSTSTRWGSLKVGAILTVAIAIALWTSLTGGGTSIFDPKGRFQSKHRSLMPRIEEKLFGFSGFLYGSLHAQVAHLRNVITRGQPDEGQTQEQLDLPRPDRHGARAATGACARSA